MHGRDEKDLERKARRASSTTAYMLFVVHFWPGTRYPLLFQFRSTDASFPSQDTEHQWPPNTAKHTTTLDSGTIYPSIYLPISHLPTISLSISYQCLYVSLISLLFTFLSYLFVHPFLCHLSINDLHALDVSIYVPRYLSPAY